MQRVVAAERRAERVHASIIGTSRREPEAYRRCGSARPSTVRSMPRLENRSIIVTGGASGIGRALCVAFAAEGARVVVGDVVREPLHVGGTTTDQLIADAGGVARFVEADVRSGDDIDRLVAAALELGDGRLDVIVNNAMVAGKLLQGPARDERGRLGHHPRRRPARPLPLLPARRPPDADAGAARRGARPGDQHLVPARHGRRARQRRLFGHEGRSRQPDAPDRRRLRQAGNRLQRDRPRQDRGAPRGRSGSRSSSPTPTRARPGRVWATPRTLRPWASSWPPTSAAS